MSNWQLLALRLGGVFLAVIFGLGLILVYFVFETPEGEASSSAPQIVYWILLIIGVAGAVAGFVVKPKKGVQE